MNYQSVIRTKPLKTDYATGVIEYGLQYLPGNDQPYFTVTASGRMRGGSHGRGEFGGCCHKSILESAPELAPLVALHGAWADGTPMHARASGWYWLAGACGGLGEQYHGSDSNPLRTEGECEQILADHLRISANEARGLVVAALTIFQADGARAARDMLDKNIGGMGARWKEEADAAIEKFGLQDFMQTS